MSINLLGSAPSPSPVPRPLRILYGHVSIGTTSLYAMRHDAETLAQRLVSLHSQFGV